MWEPRQGENREAPPPPRMVCPAVLVVHLGSQLQQISSMEVGKVMEGGGGTCNSTT